MAKAVKKYKDGGILDKAKDKFQENQFERLKKRAERKSKKKNPAEGAGNQAVKMLQEKLRKKEKRKARRQKIASAPKKLVQKVASGIKAKRSAKYNENKMKSQGSGFGGNKCTEAGCGAYK